MSSAVFRTLVQALQQAQDIRELFNNSEFFPMVRSLPDADTSNVASCCAFAMKPLRRRRCWTASCRRVSRTESRRRGGRRQ
jgi:hypothetical protein